MPRTRMSCLQLQLITRRPNCYNTRPQVIEKPGMDGRPLYSLDNPLTQEGVSDLIDRTVDRLLEVDSPSLETMKMQVAFDSSYIAEEEDLVHYYQRRTTRLREMQRAIATMRPKDGTDFDALTALHRQVCLLYVCNTTNRAGYSVLACHLHHLELFLRRRLVVTPTSKFALPPCSHCRRVLLIIDWLSPVATARYTK